MASGHGGRTSDDRLSVNYSPGNLARSNPVKPQVSLPILPPLPITREGKEAKDQAQQWEMSLNRIFQNMQSEDLARYLTYFKARLEVEETYIRGLEKLVVPPKNFKVTGNNGGSSGGGGGTSSNNSINGGHEGSSSSSTGGPGGNSNDTEEIPTTLHMALDSLLASTVRAASSRRQFSDMLRNISGALSNLKDNHERMRKKQKDDVKPIFQLYAEIRLSTLPKAKRTYEQKCREVEQVFSMDESDHSSMRERLKNLASSGPAGRLVKCKREMEEAESEYKNIVSMLEVYRQRREEAWESSLKPVGDAEQVCMTFTRDASSHPKTVLYESFHSKKAATGIFGMSLIEYARKFDQNVPLVVLKCTEAIDRYGLKREGIYRVSGRHAQITNLRKAFEADERQVDLTDPSAAEEVHAIAAILKAYLREMPEPLFPFPLNERVAYSNLTGGQARMQELKGRLKRLDDCHLDTLQILIQHLRRVYDSVDDNKMNLDNISLIFTPAIFHDFNSAGTGPQAASQAAQQQYQQQQSLSTGAPAGPSSPSANMSSSSDQQTSPTANSFSAGGNAVSTAASWSSDHVLADLILNSHRIFNVLPKLPSRGNSMPNDPQMRSVEARMQQQHLHGPDNSGGYPHAHHSGGVGSSSGSSGGGGGGGSGGSGGKGGGGGKGGRYRESRGSMGHPGSASMSPRSDSLGPNSSGPPVATSLPPIVASPSLSPYLKPHLPPPNVQQQYSPSQLKMRHSSPHLNDGAPGHHSAAGTPPYPSATSQQPQTQHLYNPKQQREYHPPPPQQQPQQQQQQQQQQPSEYPIGQRPQQQQPPPPRSRYSPHGSEVSLSSRSMNADDVNDLL
ncbi:hypothetical protein DFQ27_007136 [Actinomortierella ambigua]|uniref:Rho-GAP domain-containing protein n=1 Tax=Actinomortierella ambigua TaxID=1343610 RepID=A0A9P6UBY7_9FUNG|nr:hypothetical protein DFQ27_007136 [Actinomortierella ambigua]